MTPTNYPKALCFVLCPQLLTWPGTSPLLHSAKSTGGLAARTWMPVRSWGLGPSQEGLERVGEEEHSTRRVSLVTGGLLAILPGQWLLGSRRSAAVNCLYSLIAWEPLRHPRRFGTRKNPGGKRYLEGGMACHEQRLRDRTKETKGFPDRAAPSVILPQAFAR